MRKTFANNDLMTTREAGETLGVAVRTVQLWVEAGVLPAWRTAGGHRRIARSAVEKLMSEREHDLAPELAPVEAAPRPLKLLLVEDDMLMSRLFRDVVSGWRFPVQLTSAADGFEALVRIGEIEPDVVITDLIMPGMDGFAMLHALTKPEVRASHIKLIVMSVLNAEEIAERGGLPNGVTYFQKPVHYGKLEALVHQYYRLKVQRLSEVSLSVDPAL